jgi:hypothetical protein
VPQCWQLQSLILFREVINSFRGSLSGRGKTPLSGSFQSYAGETESDDLEAFAVYGDVVVIPAEGDQIVGIGLSTVGPGDDMVDLQAITEGTAVDSATSVTVENMPSQVSAHGSGSASQVEWFAFLGEADQIDIPVTENLFERTGSESRPGQDRNTGLPLGFCSIAGVDDHRHVDRSRF